MKMIDFKKDLPALAKMYYCSQYNIHMVVMQQFGIVINTVWDLVSSPVIRKVIDEDN